MLLPADISVDQLTTFQTTINTGLVIFVASFVIFSEFAKQNAFQGIKKAKVEAEQTTL